MCYYRAFTIMRYQFTDGKILEAETPEEFVEKMRGSSFFPADNTYEFMHDVAERGRRIGIYIKVDNEEKFLDSLISYGIVVMLFPGNTSVLGDN